MDNLVHVAVGQTTFIYLSYSYNYKGYLDSQNTIVESLQK